MLMKDKKKCVSTTASDPKLKEKSAETLKPGMQSLLETIESFLQLTDMIREMRINVARRLFHIDNFNEMSIEERVHDVKLPKRPLIDPSKRKYNTNSSSLDNRAESVSVVKTKYLRVTFGDKTGLESFNGAIRKIFSPKHPFGADNVGVGRARDQNPSAIILQSSNFFIPGGKLGRVLNSRFKAFKLSGGKKSRKKARGAQDNKICRMTSLKNTNLSMGEHGMRAKNRGSRWGHKRWQWCLRR